MPPASCHTPATMTCATPTTLPTSSHQAVRGTYRGRHQSCCTPTRKDSKSAGYRGSLVRPSSSPSRRTMPISAPRWRSAMWASLSTWRCQPRHGLTLWAPITHRSPCSAHSHGLRTTSTRPLGRSRTPSIPGWISATSSASCAFTPATSTSSPSIPSTASRSHSSSRPLLSGATKSLRTGIWWIPPSAWRSASPCASRSLPSTPSITALWCSQ
mmetsp:Transcript_5065/g.10370  ORF Transcript_5065/g.10370 Transcript_5065/m.10370 type:complete len:213 (-) Transcript_5065:1766-2404(-)